MGSVREPMFLKRMHRQDLISLIRTLTEENEQLREELENSVHSDENKGSSERSDEFVAALTREFGELRRSIDALKGSMDRYASGTKPREDIMVAKKVRRPLDEDRR